MANITADPLFSERMAWLRRRLPDVVTYVDLQAARIRVVDTVDTLHLALIGTYYDGRYWDTFVVYGDGGFPGYDKLPIREEELVADHLTD